MARRNLGIALFLALAWSIGAADRPASAQDKPPPETKAQPPRGKAAEHATEGEDGSPAATRALAAQQESDLARHDPRGHGRSCPTAGRSSRPAVRRGWAICRSRSPCIPASRSWRSSTPGYGEHEVVTVNGADRQGDRPRRRCPRASAA